MSNISNIVTEAMNQNGLRQYTRQAAPVIAAVEEAQYRVFEGLVTAGTRLGASRAQVEAALSEVGLEARPQAAAAAAPAAEGDLRASVERLTAFARQHGYRG